MYTLQEELVPAKAIYSEQGKILELLSTSKSYFLEELPLPCPVVPEEPCEDAPHALSEPQVS